MITLGSTVKEVQTGFEGRVIGRWEWIQEEPTYAVQPHALHEGKAISPGWFPESRLEVLNSVTSEP